MKTFIKKFERIDWLWLLLLVALSYVPRLALLAGSHFVIDADEAIVGLMAKRIAEGKDWPIFYYGQHYLGSLEAILTAGVFKIFGQSNFTLRVVPLIFSGVFIAQIYLLAWRIGGSRAARFAAFLAAMPASALVLWSTKTRGGFIELVVIGTWALIITADLLAQKKAENWRIFWLGVLLGLGWWVNNQIVFYMFAIGLALGWMLLREHGLKTAFKNACSGIAGFFLGGALFWWANLVDQPRFATFAEIGGHATKVDALQYLGGFFREALPIILGARRFWSTVDIFPYATVIAYSLFAVLGVFFLLRAHRLGYVRNLLLIFLLGVPLIFSVSKFGWLSIAPRYLLPFYSVLFVAVGLALAFIAARNQIIACLLFAALVTLELASNYYGGLVIPGEPFVYGGERVARDQTPVYEWLKNHRYSHVHTNYWIGYRMAFETNEEIVFSVFGNPRTRRIMDYEDLSPEEMESYTAYLLVPSEAVVEQRKLAALGYEFRRNVVGPYIVLDNLVSPSKGEHLREITIKPAQLEITGRRSEWRERIVDGDLGSRWGSGEPQASTMQLTVNFPKPELVSRFVLSMGFWPHDFPRHLVVEGQSAEDGSWCDLTDLKPDGPEEEFAYSFRPIKLRTLRLRQVGSDPLFDWSIAELKLYGPRQ